MTLLSYERLVADFANDLLHNLRNHGAAEECLETWVPDEDPVKSILNMVEAAQGADHQDIAVEVSKVTLPETRVPELRDLLSGLGSVELRDSATDWIVSVTRMRDWSAFALAAPSLRDGLQRLFGQLDHEGTLPDTVSGASASEAGVTLAATLTPDGAPIISMARHSGGRTPVERAVLEAFCRRIEGLPLVEAADHGAIRALHDVIGRTGPMPVKGILRPEVADPAFALAVRLIRAIETGHRQAAGAARPANFFEVPVTERWAALSGPDRLSEVNAVCGGLMAAHGFDTDQLVALAVEPDLLGRPVRVTLAFDEAIPPQAKPDLIREAERRLKRLLDPALYVLHETLKDSNGIRRL